MAMDVESFFDSRKQPLVIIDLQVRMYAALHKNSGPAKGQGFFDLFVDHMVRQYIRFRIALYPIDRAERTEFLLHLKLLAVASGHGRDIRNTEIPRLFERVDQILAVEAFADGPECKHERQAGQQSPTLCQIEHFKGFRAEPY